VGLGITIIGADGNKVADNVFSGILPSAGTLVPWGTTSSPPIFSTILPGPHAVYIGQGSSNCILFNEASDSQLENEFTITVQTSCTPAENVFISNEGYELTVDSAASSINAFLSSNQFQECESTSCNSLYVQFPDGFKLPCGVTDSLSSVSSSDI